MAEPTHIAIRGAREHNLRGVDLDVPRNALVVFTGVSGVGKSSLAFDTLYKEGQRRFVESLSPYARQFLGQMERPKVESVDGLSPTLCIDQKTVNRNPRSTVGTVTEIYDHLRLLMARLGQPHCPTCGAEVSRLSVDQVVDQLLERGRGKKVQVLGPVVRDRKGEYRKEMEDLARDGWVRARVDGELVGLGEPIALARYEKHTIEVVVDRLVPEAGDRGRLAEAVETALRLGEGVAVAMVEGEEDLVFSTMRACAKHPDVAIPELEPRLFSFNAPQGACARCNGLGALEAFDLDRLVDASKPPLEAFQAWNDEGRLPFSHFDRTTLRGVIRDLGADALLKTTLAKWPEDQRKRLLHGDEKLRYKMVFERDDGQNDVRERPWSGLVGLVENIWRWTSYAGFEPFRSRTPCPDCAGTRLNPIARAVTFRGKAMPAWSSMSVEDAYAAFSKLRLKDAEKDIGELLVAEIRERLTFLHEVGLDYLTLDRSSATLSGGEAQRIRLAAQVGSGLQGVTYVLDEPSIGLHARDNHRLLLALKRLRDRGNSVIVVEHDAETILAADHVVDFGPGAGRQGGAICASGPPHDLWRSNSLTAQYLRGELRIEMPTTRRAGDRILAVRGATANNLKGVDLEIPLGTLTVLTGVSGSGKSTLLFDVLEPALEAKLAGGARLGHLRNLEGADAVDKIITISQQPIGRTPRSNAATYAGALDLIRDLFAATAESRARGYKKGRFSFNVHGGRCEACQGAGVKTVEMQFLPSVEVPCESCEGRRFNAETLDITYHGLDIHQVLELTVSEALELFRPVPKLARIFSTMEEVGLGYVPIGQPATTLSGGEAQRLKIATELQRPATGHTLYLLDEPTTGLHFDDVKKLLHALGKLVDAGNTVVVVEHHLDVVKCADHVVDLGPEGGAAGGRVIGIGTPEDIARLDTPTGRALRTVPELGGALLAAEGPARRAPRKTAGPRAVVIEGARKHNLQGIDVEIPHGQLTVVTGPSGSGKTSLAFDTVFSEGQRRYVESLSTYARRFLGRMERAPVDRMEGLAPAIAIDQANASHNPRSTVATVTEIHDVLRLLYARIGIAHCPKCGQPAEGFTPSEGAIRLKRDAPGAGWLCAALVAASDAEAARRQLVKEGWRRLFGEREVDLDSPAALPLLTAGARLVVDRFDPARASTARMAEAIENAQRIAGGTAWFIGKSGVARRLSVRPACEEHGAVLAYEVTPRHFSFNSRLGACTTCEGLGHVRRIVPERLFPRPDQGFWDAVDGRVGAVLGRSPRSRALLAALMDKLGIDESTPYAKLGKRERKALIDGWPTPFDIRWTERWGKVQRTVDEKREWPGLIPTIEGWNAKLSWLVAETTCPDCEGGRLRAELLWVRLGGRGIHDFTGLAVDDAIAAMDAWELHGERATIAARPLMEMRRRLSFLHDVGLGYLALDRPAETLSGGESQRIRLASQLGAGLTGVIYVLDEPTVGLHPRDTDRLLGTLEGLRDLGNTVLVVEHDPETIRRADHVIDLGPGAGREGGQVLAAGTPAEIAANPLSGTGRWLSGVERLPARSGVREPRGWLTLTAPTGNNLRCGKVSFPTGVWVGVSGVSGSGKSTLVMDTLAPALRARLGEDVVAAPHGGLDGEACDRVIVVDQAPIGRTPRSTPGTFVGVMDPLRQLFASTPGAQERGWDPGRFSFNSMGGRCEACEGRGAILVEMHFLPDVWITCPDCRGRRFGRETLEVRWKGRSIADVLSMRVDEACDLFSAQRAIKAKLEALCDVGLGYLTLGQPATTLSGGEAQRVKLASELTTRRGQCVYVLDEPTTGLHLSDVAKLVEVLHRLVDAGHTVLTIEHHLEMLGQADWIVDLGPEAGAGGGRLVAEGPPERVAQADTPTGRALAAHFGRREKPARKRAAKASKVRREAPEPHPAEG